MLYSMQYTWLVQATLALALYTQHKYTDTLDDSLGPPLSLSCRSVCVPPHAGASPSE